MTDSQTIQAALPRSEILAQLAEECAELSQAAPKLRRAITGEDPTPVCADDAEDAMREEIADVLLCMELAGEYLYDTMAAGDIEEIMDRKEKRWANRLRTEKQGKRGCTNLPCIKCNPGPCDHRQ